MKIGMVVPGGVDRSGTHRVIPHLVERLDLLTRAHEVHVFALDQEARPGRWELAGARIHNVGRRPRRVHAVLAVLREHRSAPFDVLHGLFVVPQGVVAGLCARVAGVPVVLEEPGGGFASLPEIGFGGLHRWQGRLWVRAAVAWADRVVVPGEAARRTAAAAGVDAEIVRWSISTEAWPPRAPRPREPSEPLRLAWIGSLNRVKDPDTLRRLARILAERGLAFTLDVVGEEVSPAGPGNRVLESAPEVRRHGFLTQPALRELLLGSHVLVVTSRFEGTPRVVLEAALAGVPSVGTEVGYLRELAPHGALTAAVGDAEGIADHVLALAADDARRCALAERAQAWAIEHDLGRAVSAWRRLYEELTGADAPAGLSTEAR